MFLGPNLPRFLCGGHAKEQIATGSLHIYQPRWSDHIDMSFRKFLCQHPSNSEQRALLMTPSYQTSHLGIVSQNPNESKAMALLYRFIKKCSFLNCIVDSTTTFLL